MSGQLGENLVFMCGPSWFAISHAWSRHGDSRLPWFDSCATALSGLGFSLTCRLFFGRRLAVETTSGSIDVFRGSS
jgi:hypothetical protein